MTGKRILPAIFAFLLSSCAALPEVGDYHEACMKQFSGFSDEVLCIKRYVAADPAMNGDTLVQEYVMTGEKLASGVQNGTLGPDDARLQLLQKLNDIKQKRLDRLVDEARLQRMNERSFPRGTTCHRVGDTVQCTTF